MKRGRELRNLRWKDKPKNNNQKHNLNPEATHPEDFFFKVQNRGGPERNSDRRDPRPKYPGSPRALPVTHAFRVHFAPRSGDKPLLFPLILAAVTISCVAAGPRVTYPEALRVAENSYPHGQTPVVF